MGTPLSKDLASLPLAYTRPLGPGEPQRAPRHDPRYPDPSGQLPLEEEGEEVEGRPRREEHPPPPSLPLGSGHGRIEAIGARRSVSETAALPPAPSRTMPRPTQTLTFSSLPSGSVVGLCHQGIVSLSPNLGLLDSITHLQLCCNHLTSLPPEIAYLSSLTTLDLSRNHLRDLPPSIALLPRLTHLHLARNHLSRFPPALALLPHLEELHLEGNLIPILPGPIIGAMKSLISLDLSHNPIRWIPVEATRLTHLQRIRVEGCPFPHLSQEHDADGANPDHRPGPPIHPPPPPPPPPGGLGDSASTIGRDMFLQNPSLIRHGSRPGSKEGGKGGGGTGEGRVPSLKELSARTFIRHHGGIPTRKLRAATAPGIHSEVHGSSEDGGGGDEGKKGGGRRRKGVGTGRKSPDPRPSTPSSPIPGGAMPVHLPSRILRYLERAEVCADCGGPWFDWWVDRVRMVDRSDLSIPVLHRLCFSHWSSEEERVAMLFGPRPRTSMLPGKDLTSRSLRLDPWVTVLSKERGGSMGPPGPGAIMTKYSPSSTLPNSSLSTYPISRPPPTSSSVFSPASPSPPLSTPSLTPGLPPLEPLWPIDRGDGNPLTTTSRLYGLGAGEGGVGGERWGGRRKSLVDSVFRRSRRASGARRGGGTERAGGGGGEEGPAGREGRPRLPMEAILASS